MFAQSATAFGQSSNTAPPNDASDRTIYRALQDAGRSWMIYSESTTIEDPIYHGLHDLPGDHFGDMTRFASDAVSGSLPNFAWVESRLTKAGADDEHPPADVQVGQQFVANTIAAVMASPNWSRSAIFLIYDEHGGFFDHVAPPTACAPDPGASDSIFLRYGMRVPFVVASPFARPNHVSHVVLSHTSILRLVEARFDLPALSGRDANEIPPFDLFDFEHPAFMTPPSLPAASIDPTELARCKKSYM
jgi:phospholipase C